MGPGARMAHGFEAGRVSAARLLSSHARNVTIAADSRVSESAGT